ncbi:MAG: hypothetical protein ACOC1P_05380 [Minisyncoccales bacterium]
MSSTFYNFSSSFYGAGAWSSFSGNMVLLSIVTIFVSPAISNSLITKLKKEEEFKKSKKLMNK